jgi:hypothetical protein
MTLRSGVAERVCARGGVRCFGTPLALEGFDFAVAYHPRSSGDAGILWLRKLLKETAASR